MNLTDVHMMFLKGLYVQAFAEGPEWTLGTWHQVQLPYPGCGMHVGP